MNQLGDFLKNKVIVEKVSSTRYAIKVPMYKLDGEAYEVFLLSQDEKFIISDDGVTYNELDKIFELNEPDVIKNLVAILKQYGCRKSLNDNSFIIECNPQDIHIKLSFLIQAISFMLNMKIFYI